MQVNHSLSKTSHGSTTPPLDSSSEDLEFCIDYELDDLEKIDYPRKPHFLDYDYLPPTGSEEPRSVSNNSNTTCHSVDTATTLARNQVEAKTYELDGELSDCVLAVTNKQNLTSPKLKVKSGEASTPCSKHKLAIAIGNKPDNFNTGTRKKKQPYAEEISRVASLYCREAHSLDRNFERLDENINLKYERKFSLDRDGPPNCASPRFQHRVSSIYHRGTWPIDKPQDSQTEFSKLGPKVECVYSLLSMLGSNNSVEMSMKFLDLSKSLETCIALRRSGCIPLLVQMMHSDTDELTRKCAGQTLHNVIHCHPDDKVGRREAKVLRLIEQIIAYNEFLKNVLNIGESVCDDIERHPSQAIYSLMKISFDEEHRHAMCQLGALPVIANLVHLDHSVHGSKSVEVRCITLRRYSGMALTNLTFGDGNNKALLCSNKSFMKSLVNQLDDSPEELIQVTACVLRNLSWRADNNIKFILTEIGTVTALTKAAMKNQNENTLKSILSALWNLTAHCSMNKAELCNVDGALAFLADMLVFEAPGKNLSIIENAGGILRNVSSHIAVREDYRKILRQRNCLGILLQQLKSESLTVVSNACGTLWNLSARCSEDQKFLCDNGAVPMLRSLIHSKHKMISNGSNAALKNLLNFKPTELNTNSMDPIAKSMNLKELPSLNMRKQRALKEGLDQNFSETCENIDVITPPKEQNVQDFCAVDQNLHYIPKVYIPKIAAPLVKTTSKDSATLLKSTNLSNSREDQKVEPTPTTSNCFRQKKQATKTDNFLKYNDESNDCDQLTDFSVKYNREQKKKSLQCPNKESDTFNVYQETDLDQITDFSLRYAEKHSEHEDKHASTTRTFGNEIILALDDTVRCYETEGTPYVISNAASMSDLRNHKSDEKVNDKLKLKNNNIDEINETFNVYGINTPEKPVNYCDEGTPECFSRRNSNSSLDETISSKTDRTKIISKNEVTCRMLVENIAEISEMHVHGAIATTPGSSSNTSKVVPFEPETPLMFSRHSSIESLSSVEPNCIDDQSSVVSEFSRLTSGIISPSELPDSPTQGMPETPRTCTNFIPRSQPVINAKTPLPSVFEDDTNTFNVENTPAQFSSATSLSNLSLDDEPKINNDNFTHGMTQIRHPSRKLDEEQEDHQPLGNDVTVENIDDCKDNLDSDAEESSNDDILLATCINIGMNRGTRPKQKEEKSNININLPSVNDDLLKYWTEDTPEFLSKSSNKINLSILSMGMNKEEPTISDDSMNSSDIGNDRLLEECIRDGMKKSSPKDKANLVCKENPIAMMRSGSSLLTSYLTNKDETNRFYVEDSPCNFSAMSALSSLTIDSDVGSTLTNAQKRWVIKNGHKKEEHDMTPRNSNQPSGEDSLSSVSIDSEDDNNLLSQAIEAGFQAKPKYSSTPLTNSTVPAIQTSVSQLNVAVRYGQANNEPNESFSSIDSYESNENRNKILIEREINNGMNRDLKPVENKNLMFPIATSATKKSFLPMFKNLSLLERDKRDKKDEQLLLECINSGMTKSLKNEQIKPSNVVQNTMFVTPPVVAQLLVQPQLAVENLVSVNPQQIIKNNDLIPNSKNGQATSVVVSEMENAFSTTTDVGKDLVDGIKEPKEDQIQHNLILKKQNGSSVHEILNKSINQFLINSENLLETSNEYTAVRSSNIDLTECSSLFNSIGMDMSNEFLIDSEYPWHAPNVDKHKDPDLMLESVDRLTHELVSTAEYLRTTSFNNDDSLQNKKILSGSNSNNTWNEDTCPNDVSFPSISLTIPLVKSINETTLSDIILRTSWRLEEKPTKSPINQHYEMESNKSVDTTITCISNADDNQFNPVEPESNSIKSKYCRTPTNEVNFEVGGEVKPSFFVNSLLPFGMTTSIIAREANKVVDQLFNFSIPMTDCVSSLDLGNIRATSPMDILSSSGYYDVPLSPKISHNRKKTLSAGFLARRALGHIQTNADSFENVNCTCNLYNIKQPSLMDELLDSMTSVESIRSEICETHYDVIPHNDPALIDIDDTLTLQSVLDMSNYESRVESDFVSVESTATPTNDATKRNLTPKQKRQLTKERYRTYTIAADMVLKEKMDEMRLELNATVADDTKVKEDIINVQIDKKQMTLLQQRLDNRNSLEKIILDMDMLNSYFSLEQCNQTIENTYSNKSRNEDQSSEINTNIKYFSHLTKGEDPSIEVMTDLSKLIKENGNITSTMQKERETVRKIINMDTRVVGKSETKPLSTTNENLETLIWQQEGLVDKYCSSVTSEEFPTFTKPMTRFIKSSEKSKDSPQQNHSTCAKAIRGSQKSPYVSPYRRTVLNNKTKNTLLKNLSTRTNSEKKKTFNTGTTDIVIPKNQTILSQTHVVTNKSNLNNKINGLQNNTLGSMRPTTHNLNATKNTTKTMKIPVVPRREGTFTKEEPTNSFVPVVSSMLSCSPKHSKLPIRAFSQNITQIKTEKSPAKTLMSKLRIQKSTSMDSDIISPTQQKTPSQVTPLQSTQKRNANTTQKRRSLVLKSSSVPSVPIRLNSNTSMKNITNLNVNKKTLPTTSPLSRSKSLVTKGNISSKIAGLWKKSNDSLKKNQSTTPAITLTSKSLEPKKLIGNSVLDSAPIIAIDEIITKPFLSKQATATNSNTSPSTQIGSENQIVKIPQKSTANKIKY